jgi:hypothetical protein
MSMALCLTGPANAEIAQLLEEVAGGIGLAEHPLCDLLGNCLHAALASSQG